METLSKTISIGSNFGHIISDKWILTLFTYIIRHELPPMEQALNLSKNITYLNKQYCYSFTS